MFRFSVIKAFIKQRLLFSLPIIAFSSVSADISLLLREFLISHLALMVLLVRIIIRLILFNGVFVFFYTKSAVSFNSFCVRENFICFVYREDEKNINFK